MVLSTNQDEGGRKAPRTLGLDGKLLLAIAIVGIAAIAASWGAVRQGERRLLKNHALAEAVKWATFVQTNLSYPDEVLAGVVSEEDERVFEFATEAGRVFRYKIFGSDGVITLASNAYDVGESSTKPYFTEVVAKGGTFVKLVDTERRDAGDERGFRQSRKVVSEAYVPIMEDGGFKGAIEIYVDETEQAAGLRRSADYILAGLVGLLIVIGAVCGVFVRHNIRRREQEWLGVVEAEGKLLRSERKYRYLTESASDAIISIDAAGNVLSWNLAAEDLFGYGKAEIIGKPLEMLIPDRNIDAYRELIAKLQSGASTDAGQRTVKGRGVTRDGREISLEMTLGMWETEGFANYTFVVRDNTEREQIARERARLTAVKRQAQKLESLGTLAGGIAHDVNNTLVPILGLTELVIEDLPEGGAARGNLELVLTAGRRIRSLVEQILTFSRQSEPDTETHDLGPLLGETLALLRSTLPTTVEIESDLEPVRADVDATAIHQVLMNLSVNAADAMAAGGGVLKIALRRVEIDRAEAARIADLEPGAYAKLTVADTGAGMDEATVNRVFDPFFTTKDVGEGSGMGLTVVHGIVSAHGGAVAVSSELGRGTTFEIYLPAAGEAGSDRRDAA